jgi:hypothetical protein
MPKIETSGKELLRSQWSELKIVGWKSINDDDNHAMEPLNRTYSVISADAALFQTHAQVERRIYVRTNVGNEKEQPLTSQSLSKNDGRSYIYTHTSAARASPPCWPVTSPLVYTKNCVATLIKSDTCRHWWSKTYIVWLTNEQENPA